jgi:hypothetical protein
MKPSRGRVPRFAYSRELRDRPPLSPHELAKNFRAQAGLVARIETLFRSKARGSGTAWPPPASPCAGLVVEYANSSSEPCNQLASLAAKGSVIHRALLIDGIARCFRMRLQEAQHGIECGRVLRQFHRACSNAPAFAQLACIGFAPCGNAVSPQSIGAHGDGAHADKMFHRYGAPKADLGRKSLWYRQPRHGNQIAACKIKLQMRMAAGVILTDQQQSGAVELHIVEQPSPQRRQIGNGFDVIVAPTCEQPHPPAPALLAKEKVQIGLDQDGESFSR